MSPLTHADARCASELSGSADARHDPFSDPAPAHCSRCDAVCCRLTVVVQPEDGIAEHLTARRGGLRVMAHDADGWCVALDSARMCCSIYDARPAVCRRFEMNGPHCQAVREDYLRDAYPAIASTLIEDTP